MPSIFAVAKRGQEQNFAISKKLVNVGVLTPSRKPYRMDLKHYLDSATEFQVRMAATDADNALAENKHLFADPLSPLSSLYQAAKPVLKLSQIFLAFNPEYAAAIAVLQERLDLAFPQTMPGLMTNQQPQ